MPADPPETLSDEYGDTGIVQGSRRRSPTRHLAVLSMPATGASLLEMLRGRKRLVDLPDDARVLRAGYNVRTDCIELIVESERYPETYPGTEPIRVCPLMHVGLPDDVKAALLLARDALLSGEDEARAAAVGAIEVVLHG